MTYLPMKHPRILLVLTVLSVLSGLAGLWIVYSLPKPTVAAVCPPNTAQIPPQAVSPAPATGQISAKDVQHKHLKASDHNPIQTSQQAEQSGSGNQQVQQSGTSNQQNVSKGSNSPICSPQFLNNSGTIGTADVSGNSVSCDPGSQNSTTIVHTGVAMHIGQLSIEKDGKVVEKGITMASTPWELAMAMANKSTTAVEVEDAIGAFEAAKVARTANISCRQEIDKAEAKLRANVGNEHATVIELKRYPPSCAK